MGEPHETVARPFCEYGKLLISGSCPKPSLDQRVLIASLYSLACLPVLESRTDLQHRLAYRIR